MDVSYRDWHDDTWRQQRGWQRERVRQLTRNNARAAEFVHQLDEWASSSETQEVLENARWTEYIDLQWHVLSCGLQDIARKMTEEIAERQHNEPNE
eukprot:5575586-Heterocapsa_arctica.AAC.1